jgi:tetratricopeptide (TPR) repeat protein
VLRAELIAAQGRRDDAAKYLRREAATRPGDARVWSALALMTADVKGTAAGLAIMDEAQATAGDCVDVRLARATLYAREPGRVRPIDSLGERIETWPESEQLRLLAGLVEVYDQLGDAEGVVRTLRRIVARQPVNAAMWLKLHERAAPTDAATASTARAALTKLESENGSSVLLCDAHGADGARIQSLLPRLTQTFGAQPTRADACLALARAKAAAGDTASTEGLVERAFYLEPTRYETAEALVAHHARKRDHDRVKRVLARLAADPRWAGEPFRRVVAHVIAAVPSAVELLNLSKPLVESDPQGLAWLADCAARYRHPEAAALLDAAAKQPGATGDDWLRKALYESKENPASGPAVLDVAKAKLAPEVYFAIVAVYADSAAGATFTPEAATPAEKRMLVQARLAVKLSRAKHEEAGKLLEGFLAEKDTSVGNADWARRNLAMIYAVGGTPDDRVRAMKLLKDVGAEANASQEDLRATVSALTVLARYLEGSDRRTVLAKAITALEAIHKVSAAPTDLFALSQLYRAAGNRAEGRKRLQQLLNRRPEELAKDPSYAYYLTAALEELVEDGNFDAAATFANKLAQVRATDFKSLAAIARFEAKAGRAERALAAAEDYVRLADTSAGDYIVRSAQVAELLDEMSRYPNVRGTPAGRKITDAAVERFAAIVPNRPEAIVGLAGALASDGRAGEAFDRIERLGRYLPARLRASAGLAVVRGGAVTDPQAAQVLKWIDACLAEESNSVPLMLGKAEFFALRLDTANAAAAYEAVLAKEPRNVVALNNLSWMLAADPKTAEKALELVTRATRENGLTGDLLDTRARVRITLKDFEDAEKDLAEAISHDPTALRWFHVAVLRMSQAQPNSAEAGRAFAEAKRRGVTSRTIHPADLPTYRALETASTSAGK